MKISDQVKIEKFVELNFLSEQFDPNRQGQNGERGIFEIELHGGLNFANVINLNFSVSKNPEKIHMYIRM